MSNIYSINDTASDFTLSNSCNQQVTLDTTLQEKGKVILVFYRGWW